MTNYPDWFKRVQCANDGSGLICKRSNCNELHTEVEEILINLAGWSCTEAREYQKRKLRICLEQGHMPADRRSLVWPFNRCQLHRKGISPNRETDAEYYYRLHRVIQSDEYTKTFKRVQAYQLPEVDLVIVAQARKQAKRDAARLSNNIGRWAIKKAPKSG